VRPLICTIKTTPVKNTNKRSDNFRDIKGNEYENLSLHLLVNSTVSSKM
jgi:hypothetical protein